MVNYKKSKYLSKLLRHDPEDLIIDDFGWVNVKDILKKLNIKLEELIEIVDTNEKKRFSFDTHQMRIRANQGHSKNIAVKKEFVLATIDTCPRLYHGTNSKIQSQILMTEIKSGERNHVHWTPNIELAKKRAKQKTTNASYPAIIELNVNNYLSDINNKILISENDVYLTNNINNVYLKKYIYL